MTEPQPPSGDYAPRSGPVDWPTAPPPAPPLRSGATQHFRTQRQTSNRSGFNSPPTPDKSPPTRQTGLIAAIILLTIAILSVTFVAGAVLSRGQSNAGPTPSSSTTSTHRRPTTTTATTTDPNGGLSDPQTQDPTIPPTTDPASGPIGTINKDELQAEIAKIETFIEKDRGHTYKAKVDVEVLGRPDFEKRVLASFDSSVDKMTTQGNLLKALGLIPADLDVVASQRKLLGSGVLGFYDPASKHLVVGGDHIGPFLREVLAHELTHALDDQFFNLDRPPLENAKDGSDWSYLALVEGSAKRVENDYVASMSASERQTLGEEQLQLGMGQIDALLSAPMVLARIQLTPYDYGEPFVRGLVDRHGIAALDAAFGAPPTTSEQVLDPAKYDAHEPALVVATPPAAGKAENDGVLGELMTGIVLHGNADDPFGMLGNLSPDQLQGLLDKVMNGDITPDELNKILGAGGVGGPSLGGSGFGRIDTVKGWGGDHFVMWGSDTQGVCVRIDWRMDTTAALKLMRAALDTWAAADTAKPVIEQPTPDLVRATRCSGQISTQRPPTTTSPTAPTTAPTTPAVNPGQTTTTLPPRRLTPPTSSVAA